MLINLGITTVYFLGLQFSMQKPQRKRILQWFTCKLELKCKKDGTPWVNKLGWSVNHKQAVEESIELSKLVKSEASLKSFYSVFNEKNYNLLSKETKLHFYVARVPKEKI